MKKTIAILLALTALLCLAACGGKDEPAPTESPAAAETPAAPAEETPAAPAEEAPAEPTALEKAESCLGKDVAELIALIGEPASRDYAPSCLGEGEDGVLTYDGFSVYTYREGESERVDTVLAD